MRWRTMISGWERLRHGLKPAGPEWKRVLFNCTIVANGLLLFLVLFEDRISVPAWLQVAGRMHPLILHFPIVLVVLFAGSLLLPGSGRQWAESGLLLLAAFSASVTAIMGMLLSREPGYDAGALGVHKWAGIAVSLLTCIWYGWYGPLTRKKGMQTGMGLASLGILAFAGHEGAGITHGRGFLLEPVSARAAHKQINPDEALVFDDMVRPILEDRCMSCHNSGKAKGGLTMETREQLLKGGKNGALWDTSKADLGLLMQRIHLAESDEHHMPPKGKPQLTDPEIAILYQWIRHGSDFNGKVAALSPSDTLRQLAAGLFKGAEEDEQYDFSAADEKKVRELNSSYRVITPVAMGSPALNADFYGAPFFKPEQLRELGPVKRQIVSLNLDKMPLKDADMPLIGEFGNLRTLNLDFTDITGQGLAALTGMKRLRSVSLSGTKVNGSDISRLASLKGLQKLSVWNTGVTSADAAAIQKAHPGLVIDCGARTDTMLVRLNPPLLENEEKVLQSPVELKLKHYVPGVSIRYTLDGSEPDSLHSPVYSGGTILTERTMLRARAFKKGWLGSDEVQNYFYSERFRPDSIVMLRPIDSQYMKYGPGTLINLVKGDLSFSNGKWLGFHKNNLECLLLFRKAVEVSDLTLSSLVDINSYILPPVSIEVWGGGHAGQLRLLGRLSPEQPKAAQPAYLKGYMIPFAKTKVSCLKVVVRPVAKLPEWHPGKGKQGWIFADELFVN